MELYNVPEDSYIRIMPQKHAPDNEVRVPVGASQVKEGEILKFCNIDGMYSLCYKLDENYKPTDVCHIAAWTDVEMVELDDIFGFDKIRQMIGRAGYGKDGKGEYRKAALKDMSDEWVKASIEFVPKDHPHRRFYQDELVYRQLMNISIPDEDA